MFVVVDVSQDGSERYIQIRQPLEVLQSTQAFVKTRGLPHKANCSAYPLKWISQVRAVVNGPRKDLFEITEVHPKKLRVVLARAQVRATKRTEVPAAGAVGGDGEGGGEPVPGPAGAACADGAGDAGDDVMDAELGVGELFARLAAARGPKGLWVDDAGEAFDDGRVADVSPDDSYDDLVGMLEEVIGDGDDCDMAPAIDTPDSDADLVADIAGEPPPPEFDVGPDAIHKTFKLFTDGLCAGLNLLRIRDDANVSLLPGLDGQLSLVVVRRDEQFDHVAYIKWSPSNPGWGQEVPISRDGVVGYPMARKSAQPFCNFSNAFIIHPAVGACVHKARDMRDTIPELIRDMEARWKVGLEHMRAPRHSQCCICTGDASLLTCPFCFLTAHEGCVRNMCDQFTASALVFHSEHLVDALELRPWRDDHGAVVSCMFCTRAIPFS